MKTMRMYQLNVQTDSDEVIVSQDRRQECDGASTSRIVIPYDQIEYVCDMLGKAKDEIETRRENHRESESGNTVVPTGATRDSRCR